MLILGVHGGSRLEHEDDRDGFAYHDAAAVLMRNGEIVAAIEEERLSRMKHTNCFPARAIRFCLERGRCSLADVDVIATNSSVYHADLWAKMRLVDDPTLRAPADGRSQLAASFERLFGCDVRAKIHFCNHHYAHSWSAYAQSGFERALILSIDGDGDGGSGMVMQAEGRRLTKLRELSIPQSLGRLYQNLIKILGYDRFDEYKVMGLAPYGDPRALLPVFERCYRLLPKGEYAIEPMMTWFGHFDAAGLIAGARRKGDAFTQAHKDFAAALQCTLEKIVFHVLRHHQAATQERKLCLTGGVAHNCSMNGQVLYSGLFDEVFVQPAAHDAGGAVGAAYAAWYERQPDARPRRLKHLYFGADAGDEEAIGRALERWSGFVSWRHEPEIEAVTAGLLAEGEVIGWIQGRSEFGPRALGNRSILADPRPAGNKLRINEMVKKREEYRPFAPSVLEEKVAALFETPANETAFPFMIFVLRVREHARALLGAITHVDGTARVQTVSREENPRYWRLIHEFDKRTGVPVLLNTSFNNNAEPIVDSIDDAVACFLTTGIDRLVAGGFVVTKKPQPEIRAALAHVVPTLPSSRKLAVATGAGEAVFEIESVKSAQFGTPVFRISRDMFEVLQRADGSATLSALAEAAGIDPSRRQHVVDELFDLWTRRLVRVAPQAEHAPSASREQEGRAEAMVRA
jgi:carbamoyltransferase